MKFVARDQSAEPLQPGEQPFHDPATLVAAQRPVGHIQPQRPALDSAQHEMPHRIDADGAKLQGMFYSGVHFFELPGGERTGKRRA